MKKYITWFLLWNKRLLRKPLYLITLLLMPLFVIFLTGSIKKEDAAIRVAYAVDSTTMDTSCHSLVQEFEKLSTHAITFLAYDDISQMKLDIQSDTLQCGYILPGNLNKAIQSYEKNRTPFIHALRKSEQLTTRIVDEVVYSSIYRELAYTILTTFLEDKNYTPDELVSSTYPEYRQSSMFFSFEYADGKQNQILEKENVNYLLLPIRGLTAVFILLAMMTGTLFWYEDREHHRFSWIRGFRKQLLEWLYLIVPGLQAGLIGLFTILLTRLNVNFITELFTMLLYILSCSLFLYCLRFLCHHIQVFLACIPICVAGNLIICPIFINLASKIAAIRYLRLLSPVNYYLQGVYTQHKLLSLLVYILCLALFTVPISFIVQKKR